MSDITEKTLKTIEEKKITPEPRWHFVLGNFVLWFFVVVSIIIGASAVTTIIFLLTNHDWDVYKYLNRNLFKHILISLPYLWIFILILFVLVAYYTFKHTKRGYRFGINIVIIGAIVISVVLGIIFFSRGFDSEIHEIFSRRIPFYNNLVYTKEDIWRVPNKGLLGGEIVDIKDRDNFTIRDFNGNIWHIEGKNIKWPDDVIPTRGLKIKIIGYREEDDNFFVKEVRSWND